MTDETNPVVDLAMEAAKADYRKNTLPGWAGAEIARFTAIAEKVIRSNGKNVRDLEDIVDRERSLLAVRGAARLADPGGNIEVGVELALAVIQQAKDELAKIKRALN